MPDEKISKFSGFIQQGLTPAAATQIWKTCPLPQPLGENTPTIQGAHKKQKVRPDKPSVHHAQADQPDFLLTRKPSRNSLRLNIGERGNSRCEMQSVVK